MTEPWLTASRGRRIHQQMNIGDQVLSSAPKKYLNMNIKPTKIEKGTAYLVAKVSQQEIDLEKNHVLDEMIKSVTVKGFRQGKAPKSIAEKELDPNQLTNRLVTHIVTHLLDLAAKENQYRLLGRPVLEDLKNEKTGGWTIKLQLPLYPNLKLGKYSQYLQTKKPKQKVEDLYEILLDQEKLDVSSLIIDEEVNYSLERLVTQAKSLNLPLDDYLKALGKSLDQIKKEYAESAEKSVKLDLILLEIAKQEKIDTTDQELIELAKVSNVPEKQYDQLRSIINRRKTIDFLMKL
jgi:FKBP-type peptidyl-prolyl cis-trans isomerase (trigger factor)